MHPLVTRYGMISVRSFLKKSNRSERLSVHVAICLVGFPVVQPTVASTVIASYLPVGTGRALDEDMGMGMDVPARMK